MCVCEGRGAGKGLLLEWKVIRDVGDSRPVQTASCFLHDHMNPL